MACAGYVAKGWPLNDAELLDNVEVARVINAGIQATSTERISTASHKKKPPRRQK